VLSLKGTIVTADALNCQREMARQIIGGLATMSLRSKGIIALHANVGLLLARPRHETVDKHSTTRPPNTCSAPRSPPIRSVMLSLALGVENRLHWALNSVMNEDQARNRNDNSA
jgi:predicted transposase YbfD/YdcC